MMARKVDDGTSVVEVEVKMTVKVVDRHLLIKPQKLIKKVRLGRVSLVLSNVWGTQKTNIQCTESSKKQYPNVQQHSFRGLRQ